MHKQSQQQFDMRKIESSSIHLNSSCQEKWQDLKICHNQGKWFQCPIFLFFFVSIQSALILVYQTQILMFAFFILNYMSQSEQIRSFKEELHLELCQFLQKINKMCAEHKIQLESDGSQLYNNILTCINPIAEDEPYNPLTLSNFLKQTLNNQNEKVFISSTQKLKSKYCNKDMTIVSGSTKLFGYLDSLYPSHSNLKESSISHHSVFSSSNPLSSGNNKDLHQVLSLSKPKEQQESQLGKLKSESGSPYCSRNSEQNKKLYKLYPTSYKLEIIDYATKFGLKEASQKFKLPTSKINIWAKSFSKIKQTRGRKPIDPDMEEKVCDWLKRQLDKGSVLTQKLIREKAKRISCSDEFKASKGWLQKFFKRRPQLFEAYSKNRRCHSEIFGLNEQESNQILIKREDQLSVQHGKQMFIKAEQLLFLEKNDGEIE